MKRRLVIPLAVALFAAAPAHGYIHKLYSLQEIYNESTHIMVGRVESVDAKKQSAVATIDKAIKGGSDFKRVQMNLGLGPGDQREYLLDRMKAGRPILLFYKLEKGKIACCGHVDGTWFQLFADDNPDARDQVWWRFSHLEIYLPRTYDGQTPELIKLTADVLAGRAKPPAPDPKVPALDIRRKQAKRVEIPRGQPAGGFSRQLNFPVGNDPEPRGVTAIDINGDERPDLLANRRNGNLLLINQGQAFEQMADKLGLKFGSRAAAFADATGDGHLDVLGDDFLLWHGAGGRFEDARKRLPQPKPRNTEGAGWIDVDGDGLADAIVTSGQYGILLLKNPGDSAKPFEDVSDRFGLGRKGLGVGNGDFLAAFDANGDGWIDFFYNLGNGVLAINEAGKSFRLAKDTGLSLPGGSDYKRGVAPADYDNDGDVDLFVPGPGHKAALFRNNNDGTFTNVFADSGDLPKEEDPSFAAAWGDVDGDGNLDLFVCHAHGSSRLYLGDGAGKFRDISEAAGVRGLSPSFGAALADLDGDGDADLAVNLADRVVVALNGLDQARGRVPLTVRLAVDRGATGATVRLADAKGRPLALRELGLPVGPGSQSPSEALLHPPAGQECVVTVALSDGRLARRQLTPARAQTLVLEDKDFE